MTPDSLGHGAIRTWRLEEARRFHVEAPGLELGPKALTDNPLLNRAAASRPGASAAALPHTDLTERPPLMAVDATAGPPERSGISTS
ncbi:hypothetical protein [Immundisolibacter cernigliae]|uniref:Uncharacterized protein n=1 Tax=Immundisolibacter cernigliae TaxID=1810504 RepID=A0A1B1YT27_9GAMM|nr:hypothetical protein [Immundisolibacter cernigliae]ANX03847.1 hypothetical protein PG2T_06320 [Immundisolibacter cernigliae]